jgi:hypothetical protein
MVLKVRKNQMTIVVEESKLTIEIFICMTLKMHLSFMALFLLNLHVWHQNEIIFLP